MKFNHLVVLSAFLLLAAGCGKGSASISAPGVSVTFNPDLFIGVWSGTWSNTTNATTGAVNMTVTQEGSQFVLELDMDGEVFGVTDPEPEAWLVDIRPDRAEFFQTISPVYGLMTGEVDALARITVTSVEIDGDVDSFDLTGSAYGNQMTVNVTITLDSGSVVTANAILTRA
ncbi:MAG: hypothetical protein KDC98_09670 [Planctomycetes bacterium]|nr:hypothetical protein [Planctomycetota bacterium]